jgi:hypothetical protein
MQEYLAYSYGVINARFSIDIDYSIANNCCRATSQNKEFLYLLILQTPLVKAVECTVTINFLDMLLLDLAIINNLPAYPITLRD